MTPRKAIPEAKRHPLIGRVDALVAPIICPLHAEAMASARSGYIDPFTDRWVFTAAYLWERAECCDNMCRHCPYATGARFDADGTAKR